MKYSPPTLQIFLGQHAEYLKQCKTLFLNYELNLNCRNMQNFAMTISGE
jgi:hypothetical protein